MHISQVLYKVDAGDIALPEFQRGYVWTRDQVRGFFQSLYRGYPIGGFLTWSTKAESAETRGGLTGKDGSIHLLLDGQQRVTTLYGVTRGRPPRFFEGNPSTLSGLHFNLQTETFEFYAPAKMKDNPVWIDVTALFTGGLSSYLMTATKLAEGDADLQGIYIERLNRITQIKDRAVHIEEVTGEDKTIDVVVEIFNRVNSGGTKLSKGDLALAAICAAWPAARPTMNQALSSWSQAGFGFKLDWLLRNVNAVLTGEAQFSKLADVDVAVANFCFLTQDTNLKIGSKRPVEYLEEVEAHMPGALATQWMPMDRDLWRVERYPEFLATRRELLASAADSFLQALHDGPSPVELGTTTALIPSQRAVTVADTEDEEIPGLRDLLSEIEDAGLAAPDLDSEVSDPRTGAAITIAAAYWPQGLQEEVGAPVVLAPDTTAEEQAALEAGDYRVFHSTDALRRHIGRLRSEQVSVG
jgi:hypothetical protein